MTKESQQIGQAIKDVEESFTAFVSIVPQKSKQRYYFTLLSDYHEYTVSTGRSIQALIENGDKSHTLAIIALLRLLAESMSIINEVRKLEGSELRDFIKAYKDGKHFPKSDDKKYSANVRQTYTQMVARIPTNPSKPTVLKKLYNECSKTIHFSGKTTALLDGNDHDTAIKWTLWFLQFAAANNLKAKESVLEKVNERLKNGSKRKYVSL